MAHQSFPPKQTPDLALQRGFSGDGGNRTRATFPPNADRITPDADPTADAHDAEVHTPVATLELQWYPHPGYGVVTVTADGKEPDWWRALSPAEIEDVDLAEIEEHAAKDPGREWLVTVEAPLWGLVAARAGTERWIIRETLDGFA